MNILTNTNINFTRSVAVVSLVDCLIEARVAYCNDPGTAAIICDLGLQELFEIYIEHIINTSILPDVCAAGVVELNMGAHDDLALLSITRLFTTLDRKINVILPTGFTLEDFRTVQFSWEQGVWEALLVFRRK